MPIAPNDSPAFSLRLTVLGSGDASGMPRPDCRDPACACARARLGAGPRRGNSCALIEAGGVRLAIDTGAGRQACAALLLTHYHPDHAGRAPAFADPAAPLPCYGPEDGLGEPGPPRTETCPQPALPGLAFTPVRPFATFAIGPLRCTPLPLNHPIPVLGWAIEHGGRRLAWLTDTYGIPARSLEWLAAHPCDLLALDTTFAPGVARAPIKGHGDLPVSLAAIAASGAARALLIHVGHGCQTWLDLNPGNLPGNVAVGQDGLTCDL
jgi:phosphoribosyl 1,2-cyclic phosphate phosphodiesterase